MKEIKVSKKTLIVIVGPTGVGKTETCLSVAEHYDTHIVNADSRQIFREIPIGTAAPTPEQMSRVPHHFVGTHSLTDYYSASMYETEVMTLLDKLFAEKDVVVLSGGSMMYVDAVCRGIDEIPSVDADVRQRLQREYADLGIEPLRHRLRLLDPEYYGTVDLQNDKRIIHALEICESTGRTFTSFRSGSAKQRPFNIVKIELTRDREELYERIDRRVIEMIREGLFVEAAGVFDLRHLNALNTVGYKEIFDWLDGRTDFDEAVRLIKRNTRHYAKRQMTYWARDKEISYLTLTGI